MVIQTTVMSNKRRERNSGKFGFRCFRSHAHCVCVLFSFVWFGGNLKQQKFGEIVQYYWTISITKRAYTVLYARLLLLFDHDTSHTELDFC